MNGSLLRGTYLGTKSKMKTEINLEHDNEH